MSDTIPAFQSGSSLEDRALLLAGIVPLNDIIRDSKYVQTRFEHTDANLQNIYTVPTGKKFIPSTDRCCIMNTTVGALNYSNFVRLPGASADIRYDIRANPTSLGGNSSTSYASSFYCPVVAEEGTIFKSQTSGAGIVVILAGLLIPKDCPIKTSWLQVDASMRTVYQAPAGKMGLLFGSRSCLFNIGTGGGFVVLNDTGGARVVISRYVPNGETSAQIHQIGAASIANANTTGGVVTTFFNQALMPGDKIEIQGDAAAGNMWARVSVIEVPAY